MWDYKEKILADRNNNNNQNMDDVLQKVAKTLEDLGYGEVITKVHGGKVIFVDRNERERLG